MVTHDFDKVHQISEGSKFQVSSFFWMTRFQNPGNSEEMKNCAPVFGGVIP